MLPHIDRFLHNLQANGYPGETVYNYQRDLKVFHEYIINNAIPFENIDKKSITSYKAYSVSRHRMTPVHSKPGGRGPSSRSVNRMLSALRSYLRFLADTEFSSPLPAEAVKLPKNVKRYPHGAEMAELERLIEFPSNYERDPKVAKRNRAMLELLFATGMRISELCNLTRQQIDSDGRIFITGKGRKQRFAYLPPRSKQILDAYLRTRNDNFSALFIPYAGKDIANPRSIDSS